ncbi:phosphatase PAP2 family protein [Prevotella sp.]|uniref:phosphatase PAP2 family protein n=1 Tax=Prevotella sp. TaxID=59823 RepID=UPI003AB80E2F
MTKICLCGERACMVFFLMCRVMGFYAQDSLDCVSVRPCAVDETHSVKLAEVLVPVAVAGVSALYVDNGWLAKQKHGVQNALSRKGKCKIPVDDYIQYSPMVAVYGLNLAGIKGVHSFKDRTVILAMSYLTMGVLVNSMKRVFREKRPDSNSRNSFPSGHTATAFMGAQFLYEEYKSVSPLIAWSGYAVAATTAYLRIYNDRHWINDVVAGACIGIVSTKLAYKLYPLLFRKSFCHRSKVLAALPYYDGSSVGVSMSMTF